MARKGKRKHSLHRSIGAVLKGGDFARESLFLLKVNSSAEELFERFPKLIKDPRRLLPVHGAPFPRTYKDMFEVQAAGAPAGPVNEVIWAISRCVLHSAEISQYVADRNNFESSLLLSKFDTAATILVEHEQRCGVSLWLAQAWLTLGDNAPLAERQRVQEQFDATAPKSISAFLIHYLSRRAESRGAKRFLKDEVLAKLNDVSDVFRKYAASRVSDVSTANPSELSAYLFFEAQASVIDHYEALIVTLQDMAGADRLPASVSTALEKPFTLLYRRIRDRRVEPLALAFGCVVKTEVDARARFRAEIFDSYFQSRNEEVLRNGAIFLTQHDATDAAMLTLVARAAVRSSREVSGLSAAQAALCASLISVLRLDEHSYGEATSIFSNADIHYGHSWALYLRGVVLSSLQQESAVPVVDQVRGIVVYDPWLSPLSLACVKPLSLKLAVAAQVESGIYANTLEAVSLLYFGKDSGSAVAKISNRRRLSYLAHNLMRTGRSLDAIENLVALMKGAPVDARYRITTALAMAKAIAGNVQEAIELLVDAHILNPEVPTSLPLDLVVSGLKEAEDWPTTIDVPLSFELFNAFSSDARLAELRFSFERFQEHKNISGPADVVDVLGPENRARAVLYLDRVWTPEVMRQTLLYNGTEDIVEARINVCRQLASIDPKNATRYLDEIRDRVKQQEISKGTSLLEQSKVYVDIAAIKRSLKSKIGGQYARYKANAGAISDSSHAVVERIADALMDIPMTESISISRTLSSVHLVDEAETETDNQFESIFTEVTHEFLRGDHGLNAYLSTRVRHGVLANTLRKPLTDDRLISTRNPTGQGYKRNKHWDDKFEFYDSATKDLVATALATFSSEFDRILHELRDERLQIAISHGVKDVRQDQKAAFIYRSSNLERRFMQRYAIRSRSMDEFIDVCIDNLWEKTDENLLVVRELLDNTIKPAFNHAFEQLTDSIHGLPYSQPIGDLRNAIARARTQLRMKLDEVSLWFHRSQVYDRQDYQPNLPVDIAQNMIAKTASESSQVPRVQVGSYEGGVRLPGRTLDGMVDAFYVVLSNAVEHSGLDGEALNVSVTFDISQTRYSARIVSSLAESVPSPAQRENVSSIRDSLSKSDSLRLAQVEGGSGLRKLWRSINSPFYGDPRLDFGFSDDNCFYVEISYNIQAQDENSLN
ncbi:TPA: hypothetical protein ACOENT_002129 [Stenotrophomonas maltophilia]